MMYRTERRPLGDNWIEAEFGLHAIGEQAPHMSLTAAEFSHSTSRHDRYWLSSGQMREPLLAVFPELAAIAPWHLASDGVPMHYMANARFWWEGHHCVRNREPRETSEKLREYFASTIAAGVLEGESPEWADALLARPWPEVKFALEVRLPPMQKRFAELAAQLPALALATGAEPL